MVSGQRPGKKVNLFSDDDDLDEDDFADQISCFSIFPQQQISPSKNKPLGKCFFLFTKYPMYQFVVVFFNSEITKPIIHYSDLNFQFD